MPGFARGTTPGGQHLGNSLITQIIDLQTVFAINDRQTVQKNTQTDRQVAFIGRDYSRKYLKMRLMVGEAEGCSQVTYSLYREIFVDFQTLWSRVLVIIPVQKKVAITAQTNYTNLCPCQCNPSQTTWRSGHILAQKIG